MLINKANIEALFYNLKTTFNRALSAAEPQWNKVAMRVRSSSAENRYAWLDNFPRMTQWVGEKTVKALSAHGYTIVNDDWEATIEVRRNDMEDDQVGIYANQAEMAGDSSAHLPDEIVFPLLDQGFSNQCYDGQPFFDTDHPVGDGQGNTVSVSNTGTQPLSIATLADAQNSFGAARTALRSMTDNEGRPMNVQPNVLVVPPALEDTAKALMSVDRLEDGKPNPYKNAAEVVVSARLTSDTAWFLMDTRKPVKPLIYQERKAPTFVQQTNTDSDEVFTKGVFRFGAEARAAGGYGFWQLAYGSTGTG